MSIALSVNVNKIALLRNSRSDNNPDIAEFARICLNSGANGLTAHPRPDQRHIRASDIPILADIAKEYGVEFNIEGNPFCGSDGEYPGLLELVKKVKPAQCTLVPDSNDQLTSDHGFDLKRDGERLSPIVEKLKAWGVRVSVFMDPDLEQIQRVKTLGADRIELYTGPYADAHARDKNDAHDVFKQHCDAANLAHSLGLGINAGHDLNLSNLQQYAGLPYLAEVSIGHALTADALKIGFADTVKAYLKLCQ